MKIPAAMEKAINEQIREELESAYLYLAMSAWFQDKDLPGFASWMKAQYGEELEHAHKFFDYLFERDGRASVPGIREPQKEWKSPLEAFEAAYAHEQHITSCIHDLVRLARKHDDIAGESFLDWYVKEQVEEEDSALSIVKKLRLVGDSSMGLYSLDKELAARAGAR